MRCILATSILCLQWLVQLKADTCVKSAQLTKGPGIIRDRTPQTGNYASGVDCHWKITTPTANTIVSLSFTLLNLDQWLGTSNDVLLVNLGVGAPIPNGWSQYTRKALSSGTDNIGYYSYDSTSPSKDTCVANQEGNFDPATCNLIYGTLLTDTTRNNSWYYYTGSYDDTENTMTLVSTTQDIYLIYRSFPKFSTLPQTSTYGFAATYSFVSAYCSGLTILSPQLSVTSGANATSMLSFQDNMVGKNTQNMSCSWLIQPTRMDGTRRKPFDSIWLFGNSFDLAGNAQLTVYDGATSSDTVLAQFNRLNPFATDAMIANSQGVMFITYQTFNSPVSAGFTVNWQAAYCPKQCSGSHGSCIAGVCYCNHGWSGAACDTPQGWLCDSTHYNTTDGCDCGCGIYDPDCGALTSSVLTCSSEPSLDNSAFNATQGKHFTGRCLYCPLSAKISEHIPQPNLEWNTTDGSIIQSCPLLQQCGPGSQCDAYGTCISTTAISSSAFVKQCATSADCPEATVCGYNNTCTTSTDYALIFSDPTITATRCMLLGMNIVTGLTIEMTIQIGSRNLDDIIFTYTDISIATSSALSITIGPDTWESTVAVDDGIWHSIALTWEPSTGLTKLYTYNASSNSSAILGTTTYATRNFALVSGDALTLGGFNGSMAYLRISNVIRTTLTLFQPSTFSDRSSIVAEYRFMDGSGRDLSINQNHLNVSTLASLSDSPFGVSPGVANPCLLLPVTLTDHFPLGSALLVNAVLTGRKWSLGFFSASNEKIIQVESLSSTLVQVSMSGVSAANLTTSNIITANASLTLRFEATATSTITICLFDITCSSVSYDPAKVISSFKTNIAPNTAGLTSVCVVKSTSLAGLSSTVSPLTRTSSGHYCSFPMEYTIRDCTKFQSYMTSKGYTNSMGNAAARNYAYANLDLSEQPCTCDTMPAWANNAVLKNINSTSNTLIIQITYTTIKTKITADSTTAPCSSNCFIYDSATILNQGGGGGGGGGQAQTIVSGTLANQYQKVRDFTFVKNGNIWQVRSVSSVGNISPSLCVVTGADANLISNNISALSCLTTGASTLEAATSQPWCLVNSQQEICLSEVNSCNLPLGVAMLTNTSGTITDGYVSTCTAGVHKCVFNFQPTVLSALKPFAQLIFTFQQLQLASSDNVILTDLTTNLTLGNTLSGSIDTSSLPVLVGSIGPVRVEYDGYGDKSGQANDGFVIEYDTIYSFPTNQSTHFCSLPSQTLMLNSDNHQIFPLYNLTSSALFPNQSSCSYSFSTSNSTITSLWLSFLEFNLSDANGGSGDRLEVYSVNALLNQSTLVANITNSSYSQANYAIVFNGATDYLKSTSLLRVVPTTFAFWIYLPSTTKVDCTVSTNCINSVPKPMKILGSSSRFSSAAYFTVQLAVDTGYLSMVLNGQQFTMSVNVMQDLWCHIALVYKPDQNDVFWYLNGQRQVSTTSGAMDTTLITRDMTVYIGGQSTLPDTLNINFAGQLRQVRLYEMPKRAQEVKNMLTAACDPTDISLLLCYEFGIVNATKVIDSSRYNIHGQFRGGSYVTSPSYTTSILSKVFTTSSPQLMVSFFPSSRNSTAYFRVLVQGQSCPESCNNGACYRGQCICQPGYNGSDCSILVSPCSGNVLLPDRRGAIVFPPPKISTSFVPEVPTLGYPPTNCSWHLQKSNAIAVLRTTTQLDTSDTLSIYEGAHISPVYFDGTVLYNLSAATAVARAQFLQRTASIAYSVEIFKSITTYSAQVALTKVTSSDSCHGEFDVVSYYRGKTCTDGSNYGLSIASAKALIENYWWTQSAQAYTTHASVVQLYFNSYDNLTANITAEYKILSLDKTKVVASPYPTIFRLQRRTQTFATCMNGSELGLDTFAAIVNNSWPGLYRRASLNNGFAESNLATPVLSYSGNWSYSTSKLLNNLVRLNFTSTSQMIQNYAFTIVVNVSVVLTTTDQYLVTQEGMGLGSIVLKITASSQGTSQWVFGSYGQNTIASMSPASFSGDNAVLAVTFDSGVITYFLNGIRYGVYDTNTAYKNCVSTQYSSYIRTGVWPTCTASISGFSTSSRLIIGMGLSDFQIVNYWRGNVYSVQFYQGVLSDAIIASMYSGVNSLGTFTPQMTYINSINGSSQATLTSIELLSTKLTSSTVSAITIRSWSVQRQGCAVPPTNYLLNTSELSSLLNEAQLTNIVYNAYDQTSAIVSWKAANGSVYQSKLARIRQYAYNLDDATIISLLVLYGSTNENQAYSITNLWVNSLSNTSATVTFTFLNELSVEVAAVGTMSYSSNQWQVPSSVVRVIPPAFGVGINSACAAMGPPLTAASGVIATGQLTEAQAATANTHCQWVIQAATGVAITIEFQFLNVLCTEGSVDISTLGQPVQHLCGLGAGTRVTMMGRATIVYNMGSLPAQATTFNSTGFYATYTFSSYSSSPNTTSVVYTYSTWTIESTQIGGSNQCQLNSTNLSISNPWQVVSSAVVSTFNFNCYNYTWAQPDYSWIVASYGDSVGSTNCTTWMTDESVPWTAYAINTVNATELYSIPSLKVQNPSIVIPALSESLMYEATGGQAEITFNSSTGGRGQFLLEYFLPRVYYVAPASYRSSSDAMGMGTRELPYTYNFSYLISNILEDGDMLRLFPGRYEGTGYCDLTISKSFQIESISGADWTLVSCLGTSRGWSLTHQTGLTIIKGLAFTKCATSASPLIGVALYITGQVLIDSCKFMGNSFLGQGTVGVVAPSTTTFVSCIFDSNVANYGGAIAVLSAVATLKNCLVTNNNSTTSGAIYVAKYSSGSTSYSNPSVITIVGTTFSGNLGVLVSESALSVVSYGMATITDTLFTKNLGGAIMLDSSNLTLSNSSFIYNSGVGLAMTSSSLNVATTNFTGNTGTLGGALYIMSSTVHSSENTFINNQASSCGGAVYLYSSSFTDTTSFYRGNYITNSSFAKKFGGALYAENCFDSSLQALVYVKNSTFHGNNASSAGAVLLSASYAKLVHNTFKANSASTLGGAVCIALSNAQGNEIMVEFLDNHFESNRARLGGGVYIESSDHVTMSGSKHWNDSSELYGGGVAFAAALFIYITDSIFKNCQSSTNGGGLYATTSGIFLTNVTFNSCAAQTNGGGVLISSTYLSLMNGSISNSTAGAYGGGIVLMNQDTQVSIINTTIVNVRAKKGGAIYMIDCNVALGDIVNLTIANASATVMGGGMYLVLADIILSGLTTVQTIAASGGMLASEDSSVQLINSTIQNASVTSNGGAFYCIISTLVLQSTLLAQHSAKDYGGTLYAFSSTISFVNSTINSSSATSGGVIFVSSSTLSINTSYLGNNMADIGGVVYSDRSDVKLNNSLFRQNVASISGGAVFLTANTFWVANTTFENNQASQGGAVALTQPLAVALNNCTFKSNHVIQNNQMVTPQGGAISITDIGANASINATLFLNNSASTYNGGAVFASMAGASSYALYLTQVIFINNSGGSGGGCYLNSMITQLNNTTWQNNTAITGGGAAIYWKVSEPLGLLGQSYINNSGVYGPNYASTAYGLLPKYTPPQGSTGTDMGEASGENFAGDFVVHVVDQYMQTVKTDNSTEVTLGGINATIIGAGKATSEFGVCNFSTSGVQHTPGLSVAVSFASGSLLSMSNVTVPIRKCQKGEVIPSGLNECVKCAYGQFSWNSSETACHSCPTGAVCPGGAEILALAGYWRFPNTTGVCTSGYDGCSLIACSYDGACNGLVQDSYSPTVNLKGSSGMMAIILPSDDSGVYSVNQTVMVEGNTYNIVQITTLSSDGSIELSVTGSTTLPSTGSITLYLVNQEACATGYTGHLCYQCAEGYTRSGKTQCASCPTSLTLTIFVLFGGIIACVAVACILIRMTIKKSRIRRDLASILCKIFTSYLQLVSLAGSFDLHWPEAVLSLFNTQSAISNPTDKLISIECLMAYYTQASLVERLSTYYAQLILYLCLPIICVVFPVAFWIARYHHWYGKLMKKPWGQQDRLIKENELASVFTAIGENPSETVVLILHDLLDIAKGPKTILEIKTAYITTTKNEIRDKTILSIIVLWFLIHPGITKQIFQMFTCTKLGVATDGTGLYYLNPDLDVQCYTTSHYRWMFCVGIPSLLCVTVGIPLFALSILLSRRHMLDDPRVKLRFGFLYDGYKVQFFYWEIWVMMRKVLVSFIAVFLKTWGTPAQSLGAAGLTFVALYLHMDKIPYEVDEINSLEEMSLLTCLFTLYCGLYLYQSEVVGNTRTFLAAVVVIVNCLFLLRFTRLMGIELKKKALRSMDKVAQNRYISQALHKVNMYKVQKVACTNEQAIADIDLTQAIRNTD